MEQCVFILLQYFIRTLTLYIRFFKQTKSSAIETSLFFTWCCNPIPCHVTEPNLSVCACVSTHAPHIECCVCVRRVSCAASAHLKMAPKPVFTALRVRTHLKHLIILDENVHTHFHAHN